MKEYIRNSNSLEKKIKRKEILLWNLLENEKKGATSYWCPVFFSPQLSQSIYFHFNGGSLERASVVTLNMLCGVDQCDTVSFLDQMLIGCVLC